MVVVIGIAVVKGLGGQELLAGHSNLLVPGPPSFPELIGLIPGFNGLVVTGEGFQVIQFVQFVQFAQPWDEHLQHGMLGPRRKLPHQRDHLAFRYF